MRLNKVDCLDSSYSKHTHACTHTRAHVHTHTHTHPHTLTHTHLHAHTHTHTYMHTHIHTHNTKQTHTTQHTFSGIASKHILQNYYVMLVYTWSQIPHIASTHVARIRH